MVDGWLGLRDRRLRCKGRGGGTLRFRGPPRGQNEVARAFQHRLHLRNSKLPPRKLRKIAVAQEFTECVAVPCERAVGVDNKIVKKLLRRSMRGAHRESLLDEGAHGLGDQVGKGVRLFRAEELTRGQEFLESGFIRKFHARLTAQQPPPAVAEARRGDNPSGPTGPEDFIGNVDRRSDIEDVFRRSGNRKRVSRRCANHTRSSRWRGGLRSMGTQSEKTKRYDCRCQRRPDAEKGEWSFHQCLRERSLKKAISEAT